MQKLRFIHPIKHRYYLVYLTQDLFGEWVILKVWGGLNKKGGQTLSQVCLNYEEALEKITKIIKTREKRGYYLSKPNF